MLAVNDALDAIYLGAFLFGILFVLATLVVGSVDIGGHHNGDFGPFNLSTILGFVAWFGGVGYLVKNGLDGAAFLSVLAAVGGGIAGGAAIYWVLAKVVAPADKPLDPKDYELPGTIGRVSSSIRLGGVGEVVFEQQGVRQVIAAKSLDEIAIPRGLEVVILRTDHGIAYVQPWEMLLAEHAEQSAALQAGDGAPAARA